MVHSTRCRLGLTHAENYPMQLQRCAFGLGAGPRIGSGMSIHLSTEVSLTEKSLEISVRACLWNGAKGFTFVKLTYLYCFSALSEHVTSGQCLISLTHFRKVILRYYHLEKVDAFYVIGIFSCCTLD